MSRPRAYRVPDVAWPAHREGLRLTLPLGDTLPPLGTMIPVFDVDYVLTQHEVVLTQFPGNVTLGPAKPWPTRRGGLTRKFPPPAGQP